MSACDCDMKDSNGGTCDNSCKEQESFMTVENSSSRGSFTPVVTAAKVAGAVEVVSFNDYA